MILLDTSVLIEMFRVKDKTSTYFYQLSKDNNDFCISILIHYEIFRGSNSMQDVFWTNILENIEVIPFDIKSSNEASRIYKLLKLQNKMIDFVDLLIAATAISHNLNLATLNVKHFGKIPNLHIFNDAMTK
jgi:predicted nucleic acid-binding protein